MVGYINKKMMFKYLFYFNKWTNTFSLFDAMIFLVLAPTGAQEVTLSVCPCVIFSYSSINFQIFVSAVSQVYLRSLSAGSHQLCSSLSGVSQGSLLCWCRHRNKRLVVIKGSQIWSIRSFLWWLKECLTQPMCTQYKVRCSVSLKMGLKLLYNLSIYIIKLRSGQGQVLFQSSPN